MGARQVNGVATTTSDDTRRTEAAGQRRRGSSGRLAATLVAPRAGTAGPRPILQLLAEPSISKPQTESAEPWLTAISRENGLAAGLFTSRV